MSAVSWLWLVISSIVLIISGRVSTNQETEFFPPEFDKICHLQNLTERTNPVKIICQVSNKYNQIWKLDTLRDWISTSVSNQSDRFSYHITCDQSGGSVSIPWPMKCPRLVELTVRNCNITDIFSDFGKTLINDIPPQLTKLELIDTSMFMKVSNLLEMFNQIENVTSEYDCLHDQTMERITFRNVAYVLENDMEDEMIGCAAKLLMNQTGDLPDLPPVPNLSEEGSLALPVLDNPVDDTICEMLKLENIIDLPKRMKELEISCNYRKLRYLDDSISSTLSVYHHRFLTKYSKFPALEFLNVSYNYIDVIPDELSDWSFYFNVMNHMDLSHNRIHTLKFKSSFVDNLINDTYINVQYNNITSLTPQDLDLLRRQRKSFIDIRNNPIRCDCELKDFIVEISKPDAFTGSFRKYDYIESMQCHQPVAVRGRSLKSLTVDDLGCYSNAWVVPFVILAVIAVVLFTVVLLAFIYRREIRILFYTRLNIQMPGTTYVGLGPKTYHAFVSYSNEDEDWVLDVLCKQLEEPNTSQTLDTSTSVRKKSKTLKQFKLCLHARDFIPGMTIIENIINSVEKSRHTVIIVTPNFIQSKWAMEEFYQAYKQSIMERRRHLIIVIHGELPEEKMDPVLKRCLKTFTYLKASDKLFYDRLAYSLSTENKMTKEESSREDDILKSRKNTVSVDMSQESDSGIFNISDESLSGPYGSLNTQTSVISTTNSEVELIGATHL